MNLNKLKMFEQLPLRESSIHYLKPDPIAYCNYKDSKSIHFNKRYSKYEKYLQRLCIKYVGSNKQVLVNKLLSLKLHNKFEYEAFKYVYGCLFNSNRYSNDLDFIYIDDKDVVCYKDNKRKRWSIKNNKDLSTKPNYTINGSNWELVYRHNCYFFLIDKKDCYSENNKGEMVYVHSKYLQLNKKELKYYKLSNI